ncbi:hypothetical protein GCM10011342_20520 [Aquisalinus flavus]|uniref:Uncharacterized protein n=1 Tax=Aquisalinus flavus TaxID=1526572 RepID=A0A8J2V4Q1_9PROT|nr:hypothetical protein GCM10011342_20520 [Aquisalinus flavus]
MTALPTARLKMWDTTVIVLLPWLADPPPAPFSQTLRRKLGFSDTIAAQIDAQIPHDRSRWSMKSGAGLVAGPDSKGYICALREKMTLRPRSK